MELTVYFTADRPSTLVGGCGWHSLAYDSTAGNLLDCISSFPAGREDAAGDADAGAISFRKLMTTVNRNVGRF